MRKLSTESNRDYRLEKLYGHLESVYKSLLNDLTACRHISIENSTFIIEFPNALNNMVDNMNLLRRTQYLNDQRFLSDLIARLSTDLRNKWIAKTLHGQEIYTLSDLVLWMKPTENLAAVLVANAHWS